MHASAAAAIGGEAHDGRRVQLEAACFRGSKSIISWLQSQLAHPVKNLTSLQNGHLLPVEDHGRQMGRSSPRLQCWVRAMRARRIIALLMTPTPDREVYFLRLHGPFWPSHFAAVPSALQALRRCPGRAPLELPKRWQMLHLSMPDVLCSHLASGFTASALRMCWWNIIKPGVLGSDAAAISKVNSLLPKTA